MGDKKQDKKKDELTLEELTLAELTRAELERITGGVGAAEEPKKDLAPGK